MKSKIHELQKININFVSKKMFFTAVALVAFSATSMANTIEVKEVMIEEVQNEEVVIKRTPCDAFYVAAYDLYLSNHNGNPGLNQDPYQSSQATLYADSVSHAHGC